MRSETEIKNLILDLSARDDRIRAVVLNGSRANPNIMPDKYQDFDILCIVKNVHSFTGNHHWIESLGEKIIWQLPHEMSFGTSPDDVSVAYLMLFKDGTRIDLTLFPLENFQTGFHRGSLTIVWLDKDNLFSPIAYPEDTDYHIRRPTEKEYADVCNEFWWVSTYVAKGLARKEITYAKEILEIVVRPMFMKLIEWKIGVQNGFSVSSGKAGKLMYRYLSKDFYDNILKTYVDANIENNWTALFLMTELFEETSFEVSKALQFRINKVEQQNTIHYLRQVYNEQKSNC